MAWSDQGKKYFISVVMSANLIIYEKIDSAMSTGATFPSVFHAIETWKFNFTLSESCSLLIIQTHKEDNLVISYETQSFPAAEPLINYIAMEWVLFQKRPQVSSRNLMRRWE